MNARSERRYLAYRDSRLGFLFRRCHQLASGAFSAAARTLDVTPAQFGVLACLHHFPDGLDQVSIARLIVLDKATTGIVIRSLLRRGLVSKRRGSDLRTFQARLTAQGRAAFRRLDRITATIARELLAPLPRRDRVLLVDLLVALIDAHAAHAAVPVSRAPRSRRR
ncbi:MAG TPA: MarR family transcriptional regulator [Burkholderiales bacterium]|nr:MarR family transcriptional regulator [Burkholderiales bacterium]